MRNTEQGQWRVSTVRGEKARFWERRISSLPYQAKHHWYSFDVWEGENFPSINSMICLHLVLTENKPSVHWQKFSFNSLRWIYFKRKLPIFISLNLRGKVHANFSSLKHWKFQRFLNIYYKQICNYFWIQYIFHSNPNTTEVTGCIKHFLIFQPFSWDFSNLFILFNKCLFRYCWLIKRFPPSPFLQTLGASWKIT